MAITSIGQGYESMEEYHDYWTETGITYRGQEMSIDIGKAKENFNKDEKPKYFNCEIYGHMAKDCQRPKKEKDTQKCYECGWTEHIARDCKIKQKMKK